MARCLVLTAVSVCVLMWVSWNLRVGWHGGVCVCERECWVSLFVFRDRLTVLSQSGWMNCRLHGCGAAILFSDFSRNPQHGTVTESRTTKIWNLSLKYQKWLYKRHLIWAIWFRLRRCWLDLWLEDKIHLWNSFDILQKRKTTFLIWYFRIDGEQYTRRVVVRPQKKHFSFHNRTLKWGEGTDNCGLGAK